MLLGAHREESLDQAMRTYRTIRPPAVLGKYTGAETSPEADAVFTSIQTLTPSETDLRSSLPTGLRRVWCMRLWSMKPCAW